MTLTLSTPNITPEGAYLQEEAYAYGHVTAGAGETLTYQWFKNYVNGTPFVAIDGATSLNFYLPESVDTAHLRLAVTATDASGASITSWSAITPKVKDQLPDNPVVTFNSAPVVGGSLKATITDRTDDYTCARVFDISADGGRTWTQVGTAASITIKAAWAGDMIRFTATGNGAQYVGFNGSAVAQIASMAATMGAKPPAPIIASEHTRPSMFAMGYNAR